MLGARSMLHSSVFCSTETEHWSSKSKSKSLTITCFKQFIDYINEFNNCKKSIVFVVSLLFNEVMSSSSQIVAAVEYSNYTNHRCARQKLSTPKTSVNDARSNRLLLLQNITGVFCEQMRV